MRTTFAVTHLITRLLSIFLALGIGTKAFQATRKQSQYRRMLINISSQCMQQPSFLTSPRKRNLDSSLSTPFFSKTCLYSTDSNIHDEISSSHLSKYNSLLQKILQDEENNDDKIELDSLLEMDICIFTRRPTLSEDPPTEAKLELGAVQEDGTLAPLSAWTLESIYTTSDTLELLVDEEDRTSPGHGGGLYSDQIWKIWTLLEDDHIGYGSRQVGGGKGPGNPHGEESELLYYVERDALQFTLDVEKYKEKEVEISYGSIEMKVDVVVNPELEILW